MTQTQGETPRTAPSSEANHIAYAARPTRATLFWRTFIPWQLIRFAWINYKVLRIIGKSHPSVQRSPAPASSRRRSPSDPSCDPESRGSTPLANIPSTDRGSLG